MSDIACIYDMNMVEENEQLEDDLLAGRGMDVLFCLMDQLKTRREIAKRMGMSPQEQQEIYYMGLLHDIGKIGIPDTIIKERKIDRRRVSDNQESSADGGKRF